MQEERATLTRFDNELKELEGVIKAKKQAISDADLEIKKLEHDVQTLHKERTTAANFVTNLEKQYDWIEEEHECVTRGCPIVHRAVADMTWIGCLASLVRNTTSPRLM